MRDRLVELLCNVKCEGEECFGNCPHRIGQKCNKVQRLEMCSVFAIADHLLAECVIVPPCKVGDILYDIYDGENIREIKVAEINIRLDKRNKPWIILGGYYYAFSDFGETVFLTKEEAEKAIAEM